MKKQIIKRGLIVGLVLILQGCNPTPTIKMQKEAVPKVSAESSGYSVTRVAVFEDDLAYNQRRGIYEIYDNKNRKRYLGVSGIGICELGSHGDNESSVIDER